MEHLAETGNVTKSSALGGITIAGAYKSRNTDEAFAKVWDEAEEDAIQLLELKALHPQGLAQVLRLPEAVYD